MEEKQSSIRPTTSNPKFIHPPIHHSSIHSSMIFYRHPTPRRMGNGVEYRSMMKPTGLFFFFFLNFFSFSPLVLRLPSPLCRSQWSPLPLSILILCCSCLSVFGAMSWWKWAILGQGHNQKIRSRARARPSDQLPWHARQHRRGGDEADNGNRTE